nr:hypothetical protein [uncultured Pseudomonas sp.]
MAKRVAEAFFIHHFKIAMVDEKGVIHPTCCSFFLKSTSFLCFYKVSFFFLLAFLSASGFRFLLMKVRRASDVF